VGALGGHPALAVEEGDAEVLALPGLDRVGGALDRGADLDTDRLQRAPDDAQRDGINAHEKPPTLTSRVPCSSTSPLVPGGRMVVDSRSSTIAGPSSVAPAKSA